jgi:hypothetical protein
MGFARGVKGQVVRGLRVAAGVVLLAVGTALLFLPGPGLLTMAAGAALLLPELRAVRRLRAPGAPRGLLR